MSDPQQSVGALSGEEKELQQILEKVHAYPKLNKWVTLFLDASNTETWGNRTASALIAYNLDRTDPKQYNTAMCIGYQNYRKLQNVASEYAEQLGFTAGKQIELLIAKAAESTNAKYMQMLLEITGMYNPKQAMSIQNTQVNNNFNNTNVQITPEEEKQLSREFAEFIDAKYRGKPAMNPDALQLTDSPIRLA